MGKVTLAGKIRFNHEWTRMKTELENRVRSFPVSEFVFVRVYSWFSSA
jgi:hypothetical protein